MNTTRAKKCIHEFSVCSRIDNLIYTGFTCPYAYSSCLRVGFSDDTDEWHSFIHKIVLKVPKYYTNLLLKSIYIDIIQVIIQKISPCDFCSNLKSNKLMSKKYPFQFVNNTEKHINQSNTRHAVSKANFVSFQD